MAITTTFTWSIQNVVRDISDGFITEAEAILTGVAKSDSVGIATWSSLRPTGFGTVRPSPMISYADVTETNVISWVETSLGEAEVNNIKDTINSGLVNIYNPPTPTEGTGVPW